LISFFGFVKIIFFVGFFIAPKTKQQLTKILNKATPNFSNKKMEQTAIFNHPSTFDVSFVRNNGTKLRKYESKNKQNDSLMFVMDSAENTKIKITTNCNERNIILSNNKCYMASNIQIHMQILLDTNISPDEYVYCVASIVSGHPKNIVPNLLPSKSLTHVHTLHSDKFIKNSEHYFVDLKFRVKDDDDEQFIQIAVCQFSTKNNSATCLGVCESMPLFVFKTMQTCKSVLQKLPAKKRHRQQITHTYPDKPIVDDIDSNNIGTESISTEETVTLDSGYVFDSMADTHDPDEPATKKARIDEDVVVDKTHRTFNFSHLTRQELELLVSTLHDDLLFKNQKISTLKRDLERKTNQIQCAQKLFGS
jgi:hypothetical protein